MKKILLMLSLASCINLEGMNVAQILGHNEQERGVAAFEIVDPLENESNQTKFARVVSMEQLFQLILKIPQPEFVYSVMVDHIIPPIVSQVSVFESISDMLPPLSIIDSDGYQWKVAIPMVEITWLEWATMFKDIQHERFHLPLLKLMINDFLNERASNPFLGMDVKLQNVVDMCKHDSTLYSLKKRAVQCNNLEQFEEILDRLDPKRIRARENAGVSTKIPSSVIKIKKSKAKGILKNLYSAMQLDQIETENIEGFYLPGTVRNWSRSERVIHWRDWLNYIKQRADIRDLLNNKEANSDEVAQKYYIPILQFLNIETNWAKHYELMPVLMDILNEYQTFVDYEHKPSPFIHKGKYDTKAPAYVALTDYVSVLSEDLILRLSDVDFPNLATNSFGYGLSVQSSVDAWLSCLEKFSSQIESKTPRNYYLPFIKFFASKMVKGDMFFGGGHIKFITALQNVISDGIKNCNLDVLSRGYCFTDCRLLTLPEMIWDCCKKAEVIVSGRANGVNIYDVLMFLDKIVEISSKDVYLLGYNGEDLLKLCNQRDLAILKNDIKRLLWDSANPSCPQNKTYQTVKDRLIPQIKRKLNGA